MEEYEVISIPVSDGTERDFAIMDTFEFEGQGYLAVSLLSLIHIQIVPDDNAKALQLKSGELDLALLTPKDAAAFADDEAYTCYDMKTSCLLYTSVDEDSL